MSETSPVILPTFQGVLNRQLAKIMDAIDYGYFDQAYSMLKTLIVSLNKQDSKEIMENHVKHIDQQIFNSRRRTSMDDYQTKRTCFQKKQTILNRNLRGLLWHVMGTLHEKGYLERKGPQPKSRTPGELRVDE